MMQQMYAWTNQRHMLWKHKMHYSSVKKFFNKNLLYYVQNKHMPDFQIVLLERKPFIMMPTDQHNAFISKNVFDFAILHGEQTNKQPFLIAEELFPFKIDLILILLVMCFGLLCDPNGFNSQMDCLWMVFPAKVFGTGWSSQTKVSPQKTLCTTVQFSLYSRIQCFTCGSMWQNSFWQCPQVDCSKCKTPYFTNYCSSNSIAKQEKKKISLEKSLRLSIKIVASSKDDFQFF